MIDLNREGLVSVARIKEVFKHPNADRLDIVRINEWQCVATTGEFKEGDLCIYFEIDAILPIAVESAIFGADAKVRLHNARVKTIKLRGSISQGLVTKISTLFTDPKRKFKEGEDLTKELGIGKYVPTPKKGNILYTGNKIKKVFDNPNFAAMRKPVHFKKVGAFDEDVVITEKIHGTSFAAGWFERPTKTLVEKLNVKIFGKYQFCFRSMNVQLQGKDTLFHNILKKIGLRKDVDMSATLYGRMCLKYNLKEKLGYGHAICAEIYGDGVQTGYSYGCGKDEHKIVGFGFRNHGEELPPLQAHYALSVSRVPVVPILYQGAFPEDLTPYTEGPSVLDPKTKVREGCVINTISGNLGWHGSALVKNINPNYLLKEQSEFN